MTLGEIGAVAVATRPGLVGALIVGLDGGQGVGDGAGCPSDRRGSPGRAPLRLPARPPRAGGLSLRRAWSSREGTRAFTTAGGRSTTNCSAGRSTTRRARRSTRSPASSAWAIPAGRGSSGRRRRGNPKAFAFPRAFLKDDRLAFSFSGLKTAVLYALKGKDARSTGDSPPPALVADLAASFQEAVVDVLVGKVGQALDRTGSTRLGIGGGVAVNGRFRERSGGDGRPSEGSTCSCRRSRFAPIMQRWPGSRWRSSPPGRWLISMRRSRQAWFGRLGERWRDLGRSHPFHRPEGLELSSESSKTVESPGLRLWHAWDG